MRAFSLPSLHPRTSDSQDAAELPNHPELFDAVFPGHKGNKTGTHCGIKLIYEPLQRLNIKTYGKTFPYYFSKIVYSYI